MALEFVDYLHGSFSLIFVIISLIIGITILSKYPKYRSRLYILIGLCWLGLATPWIPDSVSLLMNIFIQESLSKELYFIIGNVFIPFALICWIIAITEMIFKEKQKLGIALVLIFSFIFEFVFFYLFFTNIDLIGVINPLIPFSADYGIIITILLIITIVTILITGIRFTKESIKSENEEIRMKAKLLRAAFIMFTIAFVLEKIARSILLGLVFQDPTQPILLIMLVVVRVLLILSSLAFYGGFLLPRWMHAILTQFSKKKNAEPVNKLK